MDKSSYRRYEISEKTWLLLEPHLPGNSGSVGRPASNNRLFLNAVFWILRTGASWRDLPPDLGGWKNTQRRFCRWRDRGVWEKLLDLLIDQPGYEWLMIDASHPRAAAGVVGGNQDMSRKKGNSTQKHIWPWMRMVCRSGRLLHKAQEQIVNKQPG